MYGRRFSPRCSGRKGGPAAVLALGSLWGEPCFAWTSPCGDSAPQGQCQTQVINNWNDPIVPSGPGVLGPWQNWSPVGLQPLGGAPGGRPPLS